MKTALILNFTANEYHFGCFGTAREIYHQLESKGYLVNYLSVKVTHGVEPYPKKSSEFGSREFIEKYLARNYSIYAALLEADIVVINGEGTLHRLARAPLHLMFMGYIAKTFLKKPTFLINHSCYPDLDENGARATVLYKKILSSFDGIVAREKRSLSFYESQSITARLGFDSLPLYIDRVGLSQKRKSGIDENTIVLTAGIGYDFDAIKTLARTLNNLDKSINFKFLHGGKQDLAKEKPVFDRFKQAGLIFDVVEAKTFEQWCETIATAKAMVSARFHYTVAAFSLGTPCMSMPSNTPKIEAIYELLEQKGSISWVDARQADSLAGKIKSLFDGDYDIPEGLGRRMRKLANQNYDLIP